MRHTLRVALVWLVAVILPLPLILILDLQLVDTPMHLFAYDCGIVAYVWWLFTIFLATRPRWLVNRLTLPTTYMVHGILGGLALIAATCHKFLSFSMFPLIKNTGNVAWYVEIFLVIYAILFLSGWLVDRYPLWRKLKTILEHRVFKHQVSVWLHRLNWLAVALIWLHVQLIQRLALPGFRLTVDLYTLVVLALYLLWQRRINHGVQQGVVITNQPVDDHLQLLSVKLKPYHAGDYYFMKFSHAFAGSGESHPFSVISAPQKNLQQADFLIQRLGDYTKKVATITAGTPVKLEGPFGQFDTAVKNFSGPIVLYGLGSGVAPLLSLAEQYQKTKRLHLLWTGPAVNDEYFQSHLKRLLNQGIQVNTQVHRFNQSDLNSVLSPEEIKDGLVIVVGSAAHVLQVRRLLRQVGVAHRRIVDEHLTM